MDKSTILKALGFKDLDGFYYHALVDKHFDFSANSLEGIVRNIYFAGVEHGKESLRKDIKELLNITKEA